LGWLAEHFTPLFLGPGADWFQPNLKNGSMSRPLDHGEVRLLPKLGAVSLANEM